MRPVVGNFGFQRQLSIITSTFISAQETTRERARQRRQ